MVPCGEYERNTKRMNRCIEEDEKTEKSEEKRDKEEGSYLFWWLLGFWRCFLALRRRNVSWHVLYICVLRDICS